MTAEPRTLIIGDVHACLRELEELVALFQFTPGDRVILVGDLVGKGPQGLATVRYVKRMSEEAGWLCILGNHDVFCLEVKAKLDAASDESERQKVLTMRDTLKREVILGLTPEEWAWLEALPYYIEVPEHNVVVVHAGLVPGVPLQEQKKRDMILMRNFNPETMETYEVPTEGGPWASFWKGPEHVVFGHDAVRSLQRYPLVTGLDTGCCYGRQLTGLVLPGHTLLSVDAHEVYSPPGIVEREGGTPPTEAEMAAFWKRMPVMPLVPPPATEEKAESPTVQMDVTSTPNNTTSPLEGDMATRTTTTIADAVA
jgi:hypothetical protein